MQPGINWTYVLPRKLHVEHLYTYYITFFEKKDKITKNSFSICANFMNRSRLFLYKNQSFLSSEFVPSPPKAKRQRYKAVCEKVFFTRLPVKEPYSETGQELGLTGSTGKNTATPPKAPFRSSSRKSLFPQRYT